MWSSSNSPTPEPGCLRRRQLLGLCLAWPLAVRASGADVPTGADPLAGLRRWGSGEFRRFGFLVYEATLWAGADPVRPPLALNLAYKRSIAGRDIAAASVKEMRQLGSDPAWLQPWEERMARLFPDVRQGDQILGVYRPDGALFYFNGQALGRIDDGEFARRFFAIWLDPRTRAPELRAALLGAAGG